MRKFFTRYHRWLGAGGIILAAYLAALWILPRCVNKPALRTYLRDWFENSLQYQSPVSIERLDVALRENFRADLYLEELTADSPNPLFALPWLKIGALRASAPLYELAGGLRPTAQVQIRSPRLRWEWRNGESNLAGLKLPANLKFPFSSFDLGDFLVTIYDGKITLNHQQLMGDFSVAGNGEYRTIGPDCVRIFPNQLTGAFKDPETQNSLNTTVTVEQFDWQLESATRIPVAAIKFEHLPLRLLNLFFPAAPLLPFNSTCSGELKSSSANWKITGVWQHPPFLTTDLNFELTIEPGITTLFTGRLSSSQINRDILVCQWALSGDRKINALRLRLANLDFSTLPLNERMASWLFWIAQLVSTVQIQVEQINWQNFQMNDVQLDLSANANRTLNLSAESTIANGKILFLIDQLPLTGELPKSLRMALDVPALGDTLLFFSDILPPLFRACPLRGSGQASMHYERTEKASAPDVFRLRLALENVQIPPLPAGEMLSSLMTIRSGMIETENLTRRASLNSPPLLPPALFDDTQLLNLDSLMISYEIDQSGTNVLRLLEGSSPQLGKISGYGEENPDGSFRLHLNIKDAPRNLFTDLSPAVRAVAEEVMDSEGLRFEFLATLTGSTIERRYIQDIFQRWLQEQGN